MALESKISGLFNHSKKALAGITLAAYLAVSPGCIHTPTMGTVGAVIGPIEMYKSAPKGNWLARVYGIAFGVPLGLLNGVMKGLPRDCQLVTSGKFNFHGMMDPFGPDVHNAAADHKVEEYFDGYGPGGASVPRMTTETADGLYEENTTLPSAPENLIE